MCPSCGDLGRVLAGELGRVCDLSEEGYVVAKCNKVCCICNGESLVSESG